MFHKHKKLCLGFGLYSWQEQVKEGTEQYFIPQISFAISQRVTKNELFWKNAAILLNCFTGK
jgi:hypothetical protein